MRFGESIVPRTNGSRALALAVHAPASTLAPDERNISQEGRVLLLLFGLVDRRHEEVIVVFNVHRTWKRLGEWALGCHDFWSKRYQFT